MSAYIAVCRIYDKLGYTVASVEKWATGIVVENTGTDIKIKSRDITFAQAVAQLDTIDPEKLRSMDLSQIFKEIILTTVKREGE